MIVFIKRCFYIENEIYKALRIVNKIKKIIIKYTNNEFKIKEINVKKMNWNFNIKEEQVLQKDYI